MSIKRRRSSTAPDSSPEATQSRDLPGHKRARMSSSTLQNENTPAAANVVPICSLSTIKKPLSVRNDESESDNRSEEQFTEVPTIQELSETILENSEFQNVLVQNINRIIESPDQIIGSQANQNASSSNTIVVQEQIETAVSNIIKITEQDPLFDSLINDLFYNKPDAGNNRKPNASTSTPQKSEENDASNIPIKQRLRQRKSAIVGQANNNKSSEKSKTTRKRDINKNVTVLSNQTIYKPEKATKKQDDIPAPPVSQVFVVDPISGTITAQPQVLEPIGTVATTTTTNTSSVNTDNYFIGLNPHQSYQIMGTWQSVMVNNSGNNITYTDNPNQHYFEPGSIINLDAINAPAVTNDTEASQSLQPYVSKIDDEVLEAVKNIPMTSTKLQIQDLIVSKAETPPVSVHLSDIRNKSLSTPRRSSHIRVLDFNDALPGNTEAVRSRLDIFTDAANRTPLNTSGMNTTIPSSAPPKLSLHSGPEATSSIVLLNDAILPQESSDTNHFGRDIDEDTVVSVELSIPDTPARPQTNRMPRQLSACKSSKAKATSPQQLRKSNRRLSSVVSAPAQAIQDAKKVDKKMQEWQRLRAVKPAEWDTHMREEICSSGETSTYKRVPRKKKQKIVKNTSTLQVSMESKDSTIRTISPDSSLTEEHGQLLADALASAKKNPAEPDPLQAIAGDPGISVLDSHVADTNIKQLPKRAKPNKIKITPSVKKCRALITSKKQKQQPNDEIIITPMDTINKTLPNTSLIGYSSNLAKLLETPYKEAASECIPNTPRFDPLDKSQETPLLKQIRFQSDSMSTIKCSQFPTPSFPITPGFGLTPLSKECSPRSGGYSTRQTDYSSSSSYYRPDESDDVDKNLELLIRTGRIHDVVPTAITINKPPFVEISVKPSVEPTVNSNSTHELDIDSSMNCSDSSDSSTSQSSSSGSSCSASSSSSEGNEMDNIDENAPIIVSDLTTDIQPAQSELVKNEQQELISILESPVQSKTHTSALTKSQTKREMQERNQLELEKKRSRMITSLKVSPPMEKFKPKCALVNQKGKLARQQGLSAAVASAQQKPISYAMPSTSNSAHPTILATVTPSKRKVATPRKVIRHNPITTNSADAISFVTKTDIEAKQNLSAELNDNKIEKKTTQRSEDAALCTMQTKHIAEAKKTNISENIKRIKSSTLEVRCSKLTSRSTASCASTTRPAPTKTSKAVIVKEVNTDKTYPSTIPTRLSRKSIDTRDKLIHCFGEGTLSDSDFMETPVKKTYGYDERCPEVLPALSLMPTPHKKSSTLKCLAPSSPDKPPDVSRETKSPTKTIPLTVSSPPSKVHPPPVKTQLCDPIPSVRECLNSTPKKIIEQNDSSSSETDSDEDPYKECSLSLTTETSSNCEYKIVSSSIQDLFQKPISTRQPLTFPISNVVDKGRRIRISVTDDIELFSAEPRKSTITVDTSKKKSKDTKNRIIEQPNQSSTSDKRSSSDGGANCQLSVPEVKINTVQIQKGCVDLVSKRFVQHFLKFDISYYKIIFISEKQKPQHTPTLYYQT